MKYLFSILVAFAMVSTRPADASPRQAAVFDGGQPSEIRAGDTLTLPVPTTSAASANFPHGTAPTTPVDGDKWTTTDGEYTRINGTTRKLLMDGGTQSISNSGPDWPRYIGIRDQLRIDVGNFPLSSEFGGGSVPITQGVVSTLAVPSNAAGGNAAMALSGYASTGSSSVGAVGLFGAGLATSDRVSAWGLNTITNNAPRSNPGANTGFNTATLYGYEANFNIRKTGGVAPTYALRGIYLVGDSETAPSTGLLATVNAIDVESYGIYQSPALAWNIAFNTNDGAATNGVSLGALSKTASDSASQPILLRARSRGKATIGTISGLPSGDIALTPNAGPTTTFSASSGLSLGPNSAAATVGSQPLTFRGQNSRISTTATIRTDPHGDVLINPPSGASTYMQSGGTTTLTVGSSGTLTLKAQTYAQLKVCNSDAAGSMAYVTDIRVAVTSWHQPVRAGGGSNRAFLQCMGSGWVVF